MISFLLTAVLLLQAGNVFAAQSDADAIQMEPIVVLGSRIEHNPAGRTIGKLERNKLESTDAFTLRDLLITLPGVTARQSNGPRDATISLRGSGGKVGFGVRNIKMYEDWFPVTQSDGLSRTDLHDPNAYEGVDAIRGPSSSLYDNYAQGGVINFRSRKGRDIHGVDVGADAGSFGYSNNYVHAGNRYDHFEYSAFVSYVRGDGYIDHSVFRTVTENITLSFTPDQKRTFIFKYLNNDLKADVPSRLTLDQFNQNPSTQGITNVTGIGNVSADRTQQQRDDRRTIIGGRYEYAVSPQTGFRFMGEYDVKDINQTFGTIGDNINPNFQQSMDVTHENAIAGISAKHYAGMFFNYMEQEASGYRNLADYNGTRGALQSNTRGYHQNVGGRIREELAFNDRWTAIAGLGVESSLIRADVQTRTASETYSRVSADRRFFNTAPEGSLIYSPRQDLKFHGRVGMAYGTPSISQLTTTPAGITGNNTSLDAQRNLGFELGSNGKVFDRLKFDITGYYEFFYDEYVTQSPASGLSSFTSNAPRAEHRGVEASLDFNPWKGLFTSVSYSFNDHVYKEFMESIGSGSSVVTLDRSGKQVPGVERHVINSRLGYETAGRTGGWIELVRIEPYYINNNNTLEVPASTLFNLNVHYTKEVKWGWVSKITLFSDVRNVFDQKYIGSAVVVADATTDTLSSLSSTKQAFFAGQPLSFNAGVKISF